ncbi:hypothetical protein Tco_1306516 [Tanacetum coccineum]
MASFRLLHSHLKVLSYNDLIKTIFLGVFEQAFATLFDQDFQTFKAIIVLMTQFQTFINSRLSFDNHDGLMIRRYFLAYTRTEVQQFRDTLIQHIESLKESIRERANHKREYDRRVNDRTMQSKEGKVASSKSLDAGMIVTECNGTNSDKQDTSNCSGNYITHYVDADIIPVNDKEPMAEVQLTAQHNVLVNEHGNG